jgi:antitoxin component YwqK of YwqJK toxin-antitoxin module
MEINILDKIKKKCKRYIVESKYVYKLCKNKRKKDNLIGPRKWLVILEILDSTITNEDRNNIVDKRFAKFRANKLKVIKIINTNKPNLVTKKIRNVFGNKYLVYEVGKIVEIDNYEKNKNQVCASGIHYFKTIDPAYYYDSRIFKNGEFYIWDDNGAIQIKGEYNHGKKDGEWTYWNAHTRTKGNYVNGKKHGEWIELFKNGKNICKENFVNDIQNCEYNQLYTNGTMASKGNFIDDKKHGEWIEWYCDGPMKSKGRFFNGKKVGEWIYWHDNPKIGYIRMYDKK